MSFGDRITRLRKQAGMTREEAAKALRVTASSVVKWESNDREPSGEHLLRIARLYAVDPRSLYVDEEPAVAVEEPSVAIMLRELVTDLDEDLREECIAFARRVNREYAARRVRARGQPRPRQPATRTTDQ